MLEIILTSLEGFLELRHATLTHLDRITLFQSVVEKNFFTRKEYLMNYKEISSATASRDLKFAVDNGFVEKFGDKNTSRYKFK
jgi:Fic family protein